MCRPERSRRRHPLEATETMIPATSCPRFAPGVKLQFDRVRAQWILQAPERIFVLDDIAYEILSHCTGETSLQSVIDQLSEAFSADAAEIAIDVDALLSSLVAKRVVIV